VVSLCRGCPGAGPLEAIQAYLNRLTADLSGVRTELESLAFHLTSTLADTLPDKVSNPPMGINIRSQIIHLNLSEIGRKYEYS